MVTWFAIVLGTFASEDLTCIGTGLLIQRGQMGVTAGLLACTIGIFVGDVGLWVLGRGFGAAALSSPWIAKRVPEARWIHARTWLERHAPGAIVGSRFLPGTRFALYVLAGVLRLPLAVFALWAMLAAVLWAPTIVLLTAALGDVFVARITPVLGAGWTIRIATIVAALAILRLVRVVVDREQRVRAAARLARMARWEFWPMWLFYAPVGVWITLLAIWHRGLSTITAANPGMPDGGTVGESKYDILQKLPRDCTIPSVRIGPGELSARLKRLRAAIGRHGWQWPLVLKPDVGERGNGVKLVRNWDEAEVYLSKVEAPVLAQPFHTGPFEAGVFYYRMPGQPRGRIFSITDKQFPVLVGDGASTIEALVWTHPRFRLQAATFLERHQTVRTVVLGKGELFQLAMAGNHAQGTLFRDGAHLRTSALERRIDDIARSYTGFLVGRFDIRYRDVDAFRRGEDLAIVELNGATGESTNIYDPAGSLWGAYRLLFRQWAIVFDIGAANRRNGASVTPPRRLLALVGRHLMAATPFGVSD
jgi:membrane protein DedA with SNARE-associated domain